MERKEAGIQQDRKEEILAVRNAMEVLSGKWAIPILSSIYFHKKRRFSAIKSDVDGIYSKVLSHQLKKLESYNLVKKTLSGKHPWYELTEEGQTLETIITSISEWDRS